MKMKMYFLVKKRIYVRIWAILRQIFSEKLVSPVGGGGGLIPDSRECEGFHPPEPPKGLANNYKYKPKRKIRCKQI